MAINTTETRRPQRRMSRNAAFADPAARRAGEELRAARGKPANENEPGAQSIMSNMRRRTSAVPFWAAFVASLIWVVVCAAIFVPLLSSGAMGVPAVPVMVQGLVILLLPMALTWTAAYLLYRAQQLRLVSESLMHTAIRLVKPQDVASEGMSSISAKVREDVRKLVEGVEQAIQRAGELEGMVNKEMTSIEHAFGVNEERIRRLIAGLETQRQALHQAGFVIGSEASPLLSRLEQNTQDLDRIISGAQTTLNALDEGLKDSTGRLSQTIDVVTSRAALVGDQIGSQTQRMEHMSSVLLNEVQTFSHQISHQINSLAETTGTLSVESSAFANNLKGFESAIVGSLRSSMSELGTMQGEATRTIDRLNTTLSEQMRSTSTELTELLQSTNGNVAYHLRSVTGEVSQQLEHAGLTVSRQIEHLGTSVSQRLEQSGMLVNQQLQHSGDSITEKVMSISGEFVQNVARAQSELFAYLEQSSSNLTGQLESTTNTVFDKIETATSRMSAELVGASERLTGQLDQASMDITNRVEDTAARLTSQLDATSANVGQRLERSALNLSQQLDQSSNLISTRLEDTATQITGQIDQTSSDMTQRLDEVTRRLTEQLGATSSEVTERLSGTTHHIFDHVSETNQAILSRLETVSDDVARRLDTAGESMFLRLDATVRGLGERFDIATELLDKITGDVASRLDATGQSFADVLGSASNGALDKLDLAERNFATNLEGSTADISARFNDLVGQILSRVGETGRHLEAATATTSQRMEEVSARFAEHVRTTNGFFAEELRRAAGDLDRSIGQVSEDLTNRIESSGQGLAQRLDQVSAQVDGAITRFETEVERIVAERDSTMDQVAERLSQRANQLDGLMAGYVGNVEQALEMAEHRIHEIGNMILRQTEGASAGLANHIQQLENTTEQQIADAARQMRAHYEDAIGQMSGMLSANAGEFSQTAEKMRETAARVLHDIEAARSELRQAAGTLPEETRANTEAMRKVVADQITALNALSDVVKRNVAAGDLSGPGVSIAGSRTAPAPAAAPLRAESLPPLPSSQNSGRTAPRQAQPTPAAPPRTLQTPAAREMEGISAKLNVASREITEAIEGSLPRDLEKRFSGGDTQVYTRRLYQMQGPEFVANIRARYGQDRRLWTRVDSYIRLFERLLDIAGAEPQGEKLVDACLASDSGKIFLALSEASGRLNG